MARKQRKLNLKYDFSVYYGFLKKYKWIVVFILFLVFILEARDIIQSYLLKIIVDKGTLFAAHTLALNEFTRILMIIAAVFIIIVLAGFVGRWLNLHFINKLESKLIVDLKRKYFNHIIELDHNFHITHKTGSLISRLTRGGGAMERMTDVIAFNMAPMVFSLIAATVSLIYFDWVSAIVVFSTIFLFILYSFLIQKMSQKANIIANETEDIEKGNIADFFTNIDSIKYFGKEDIIKNRFLNLSERTKKAMLKNWQYFRWLDSVQNLILGTGTFFLIYFPLLRFLNGEISLGTIVFIYSVFGSLMGPVFGFVHGLRNLYRAMADFQPLFEYGKVENEIKDRPDAEELKISQGEIEFDNLGFDYGKRKIFANFNLKIRKGKKTALVGHSGSGKTTLVKLLYRFYDVNRGAIKIDGRDIEEFKQESLRAEMSIVPQEAVLFDDSVYNNIAFSNPKASRKQVLQAMKFAQLDKVVKDFPKKENTIVGERGVKLSGGEKQRVSIARAILADKKVLVLDEATSSLDSETENEIQKDLAELMRGRTSIIIAHRLSTIMKADMIVVLKQGKIVQQGKHSQLIKQPGEYRKLWNLQKGGYIK